MMTARHTYLSAALAIGVFAALLLAGPAPARKSPPVRLLGASVLSSTAVKLTFNGPLVPTATDPSHYAVSPELAVESAESADGGYAILLTTSVQANALAYTVTASGLTDLRGRAMAAPGRAAFVGTTLGPNTTSSLQDDFNRPSGLITTDLPISGPWFTVRADPGNSYGIVPSPTLSGGPRDGAFWSNVTTTDPEKDNADVYYAISGTDFFLSAYVFVPGEQDWAPDESVGLMRLDQYYNLSQARVSAFAESPTSFALRVDWKSVGNIYFSREPGQNGVEPLVASGVPFDTWHWLQLHVRNSPDSSSPGLVEVWLDGVLAFRQDTANVSNREMTYAELGIMHVVTPGPAATTITDQVRLGTNYQLPSL